MNDLLLRFVVIALNKNDYDLCKGWRPFGVGAKIGDIIDCFNKNKECKKRIRILKKRSWLYCSDIPKLELHPKYNLYKFHYDNIADDDIDNFDFHCSLLVEANLILSTNEQLIIDPHGPKDDLYHFNCLLKHADEMKLLGSILCSFNDIIAENIMNNKSKEGLRDKIMIHEYACNIDKIYDLFIDMAVAYLSRYLIARANKDEDKSKTFKRMM